MRFGQAEPRGVYADNQDPAPPGIAKLIGRRSRRLSACLTLRPVSLFGLPVQPSHVIGETLERITDPAASALAALRQRVLEPSAPAGFAAFTADPLATWIEETFGFEPGSPADRPRRRRRPLTLPEAAKQLADQTGVGPAQCATAIKETLQAGARIVNPAMGRPIFAFRLHQFLSKGDNVYVTLEPPATVMSPAPTRSPRQAGTAGGSWCPRHSAASAARSTSR
jgi:hypothetical protein